MNLVEIEAYLKPSWVLASTNICFLPDIENQLPNFPWCFSISHGMEPEHLGPNFVPQTVIWRPVKIFILIPHFLKFPTLNYSHVFSYCFHVLSKYTWITQTKKMWKIYISGLIHLLTIDAATSMIYSYYYPAWIKSSFCQHLTLCISSLKMKMSWGYYILFIS